MHLLYILMFNSDRIVIVNKLLDRLLKIQVFELILPTHYRFVPYDIYLKQPINPPPPTPLAFPLRKPYI